MLRVKVDLGNLPSIPGRIGRAKEQLVGDVPDQVAVAIGAASGSSRIAAGTKVVSSSGSLAVIEIGAGVPFARIRDQGGTILAHGHALRFQSGEFRPRAYQPGIRYIERGAQEAGAIVVREFQADFNTI